ncbi:MAG: transketolase [Acholeplasmatales bacterium]|nr:transketolase [Acholeplasmatales bacterium]
MEEIDKLSINTLRLLGVEMINKANSGHPGIVLGSAPIVHTLFTRHINIDVTNTEWWDRDRFVLSAGHASALLYALYHLSGYKISMDDLKNFRQYNSPTPGHPEYGYVPGVEMTTGPLGQGLSSACGMALAEKYLAAHFNKESVKVMDHYTYVLCGDGDLQEGIAQEAASFAGHLKLNKLIVLYDSNDIQLDGEVELSNTESVKGKFEAMGWNYELVSDGNDIDAIDRAIIRAKNSSSPSIIEIKTIIGYGSPDSGTNICHGKPLGTDKTNELRKNLGYNYGPFEVPKEVYEFYKKNVTERGISTSHVWAENLHVYHSKYKELYKELNDFFFNSFEIDYSRFKEYTEAESTRKIVGSYLDEFSNQCANLIGGSADLTPSTFVKGADGNFEPQFLYGRNIRFGVREHAMGAIVNGINLHGGLKAFGSGFFVFSDYMKPAIRLASLMKLPSIFIFSHDTVCVGEDGPTHEPIEHFAMLRSMPNCNVIRPADAKESFAAVDIALHSEHTPTVITTSRQGLPQLEGTSKTGVRYGAYVVYQTNEKFDGILISSGSELSIAIDTAKLLEKDGLSIRVVSMPSPYLFDKQEEKYQEEILPSSCQRRFAIEMGATMPWYKYSRNVKGIDTFGISAPIKYMHEHFGFTASALAADFKKIK